MNFKPNVYGGYAIYSGQIRWRSVQKDTFSSNKLPDPNTQNEMIGPCLENVTRSHTKKSTEMDTHRKRSKDRPQTTWRRSIIAELSNMDLTMGEAEVIAQDRKKVGKWYCGLMSHMGMNRAQDYIMRQTTQNAQHGIQRTLFSQLEDLEYEDDIALLSTTANHLQKKAHLLAEYARKTGVQIHQ